MKIPVLIDTSHTAHTRARSGIQRVTRQLAGHIPDAIPVIWKKKNGPFFANRRRWFGGLKSVPLEKHGWLLLPELMYGGSAEHRIHAGKSAEKKVAAIFHDAIAWEHPEFNGPKAQLQHENYMRELAGVDLLLPVSQYSANAFEHFAKAQGINCPPMKVITLAGELPGIERTISEIDNALHSPKILCVSTFEPRKNHRVLLKAFAEVRKKIPAVELHLAGGVLKPHREYFEELQYQTRAIGNVSWHFRADESLLNQLYRQSAFTVYPSLAEGFGLPILESLWHLRPCVCANFGNMQEIANGGGCKTIDVQDADSLASAMISLLNDSSILHQLRDEAGQREIKTWVQYAAEVYEALK